MNVTSTSLDRLIHANDVASLDVANSTFSNVTFVGGLIRATRATELPSFARVFLSGVHFLSNRGTRRHGCVYIKGGVDVTVKDSTCHGNQLRTGDHGIKIFAGQRNDLLTAGACIVGRNYGTTELQNSTFSENVAQVAAVGGFIGTLSVTGCTFESNYAERWHANLAVGSYGWLSGFEIDHRNNYRLWPDFEYYDPWSYDGTYGIKSAYSTEIVVDSVNLRDSTFRNATSATFSAALSVIARVGQVVLRNVTVESSTALGRAIQVLTPYAGVQINVENVRLVNNTLARGLFF